MSMSVARRVLEEFRGLAVLRAKIFREPTPREKEVLELLAKG